MSIFKNIIKIYRIKHWYYQLGLILIGFTFRHQLNFDIFKIFLLGFLLLAFAYSFNDYSEKKQKKKYFFIPLILSLVILPFFNNLQILFSLIALIIAIFYSMKPIVLRERPIIVSFANGVSVTILFLLGYFYIPILDSIWFWFASLFFSFVIIGQIFHEISHMNEDKNEKILTTALFFGKKKIKYICYLFLFIILILTFSLFRMNVVNIIFFVSTLIFIVFISLQIKRKPINYNLRKIYVISSIVLGLIYILSFYIYS